jgi:hypothetical protein
MATFITIIDARTGEFLAEVDLDKVEAWLASRGLQVRAAHSDLLEVELISKTTEFEHWVHSGWM